MGHWMQSLTTLQGSHERDISVIQSYSILADRIERSKGMPLFPADYRPEIDAVAEYGASLPPGVLSSTDTL